MSGRVIHQPISVSLSLSLYIYIQKLYQALFHCSYLHGHLPLLNCPAGGTPLPFAAETEPQRRSSGSANRRATGHSVTAARTRSMSFLQSPPVTETARRAETEAHPPNVEDVWTRSGDVEAKKWADELVIRSLL